MKIFVRVTPRARHERIEKIDDMHFRLWVTAPASDGKANDAATKALAEHFGVGKCAVEIVSGHSSRIKVFNIHAPRT